MMAIETEEMKMFFASLQELTCLLAFSDLLFIPALVFVKDSVLETTGTSAKGARVTDQRFYLRSHNWVHFTHRP